MVPIAAGKLGAEGVGVESRAGLTQNTSTRSNSNRMLLKVDREEIRIWVGQTIFIE